MGPATNEKTSGISVLDRPGLDEAKEDGVDRIIRFLQVAVPVLLVIWIGRAIKHEFFPREGPLDALEEFIVDTASGSWDLLELMADGLERDRQAHAPLDAGPQKLLVELDPTFSKSARSRIRAAFSSRWPRLLEPGDTYVVHHRYDQGRRVAVWAERTDEQTVRGPADGLTAYVDAADRAKNVAEPPPAPPVPAATPQVPDAGISPDGGVAPPTADSAPAPSPIPTPFGTKGRLVRNLSGNLTGFTGASRIKFLAVNDDLPREQARQNLADDGYGAITEIEDRVLMGLDLHPAVAARLTSGEDATGPAVRALFIVLLVALLLLSPFMGYVGALWNRTALHRRDTPAAALHVLIPATLSWIERTFGMSLKNRQALSVWRVFFWMYFAWLVAILMASPTLMGLVWPVPFVALGCALALWQLNRDQRTLVAIMARSMQLHGFGQKAVDEFARTNATLINEDAEHVVEPYYSVGPSSAESVRRRLMRLWTDIMGRQPQELADLLERQKSATLSLVRVANTLSPSEVSQEDEDGEHAAQATPTTPLSGPAFGMIRKGYRGSASSKAKEGGGEPELTQRPFVVKAFITLSDAVHRWLDEKLVANRAKRIARAVEQRRMLGTALQDAQAMTEDLQARNLERALGRAKLDAKLAKLAAKKRGIERKARQSDAEADEDFDHDYDDDLLGDEHDDGPSPDQDDGANDPPPAPDADDHDEESHTDEAGQPDQDQDPGEDSGDEPSDRS